MFCLLANKIQAEFIDVNDVQIDIRPKIQKLTRQANLLLHKARAVEYRAMEAKA